MKVADALQSYRSVLDRDQRCSSERRGGGGERIEARWVNKEAIKDPTAESTMPTRHTRSERETRRETITGVCPAIDTTATAAIATAATAATATTTTTTAAKLQGACRCPPQMWQMLWNRADESQFSC